MKPITLYYVHDPMCAWCYGFQQSLHQLTKRLPENVKLVKLLGGLAPDTSDPMPKQMQDYIKQNWRRIETTIPHVNFNYAFWEKCSPKRSTYPACRAVIAARNQYEHFEDRMIEAIQLAYYQQARNPSDFDTLVQLADELGLSSGQFADDLVSEDTNNILCAEIFRVRYMNVNAFPSLVIDAKKAITHVAVDLINPFDMLETINSVAKGCN